VCTTVVHSDTHTHVNSLNLRVGLDLDFIFVFYFRLSIFSERELTFTIAICYRSSVCRLSVCRLSVTFVHPTQSVKIVGNVSTPFGTLANLWH